MAPNGRYFLLWMLEFPSDQWSKELFSVMYLSRETSRSMDPGPKRPFICFTLPSFLQIFSITCRVPVKWSRSPAGYVTAFRNILYSVRLRAIFAILVAAAIWAVWWMTRPGPRFTAEPIPHMLGWYVLTDNTTSLKQICNQEGVCRSYPSKVVWKANVK
jgi:hypothetical protein